MFLNIWCFYHEKFILINYTILYDKLYDERYDSIDLIDQYLAMSNILQHFGESKEDSS